MDAEIRVYERALLRSGQDPRAVACGLLGVVPARFLLLVEPLGSPVDAVPFEGFRRVTGVMTRTGTEHWRAAWAREVVTVQEHADWAAVFRARGARVVLWDTLNRRSPADGEAHPWGWAFDRVDEGWREPEANGPATNIVMDGNDRFGVAGGNTLTPPDGAAVFSTRELLERTLGYLPSFDPRDPHATAATHVGGRDATASSMSAHPVGDDSEDEPDEDSWIEDEDELDGMNL